MGERGALKRAFGRTLLLLVACLVLWGGLLLLSALVNAWGEGAAVAFARLLPGPGATIWGWLAPLSVLLAVVALGVAAIVVVSGWRGARQGQ
jgi:hypothetical protein